MQKVFKRIKLLVRQEVHKNYFKNVYSLEMCVYGYLSSELTVEYSPQGSCKKCSLLVATKAFFSSIKKTFFFYWQFYGQFCYIELLDTIFFTVQRLFFVRDWPDLIFLEFRLPNIGISGKKIHIQIKKGQNLGLSLPDIYQISGQIWWMSNIDSMKETIKNKTVCSKHKNRGVFAIVHTSPYHYCLKKNTILSIGVSKNLHYCRLN